MRRIVIRWEYKTIEVSVSQDWGGSTGTMNTSRIDEQLNNYGADGWELVAAVDTEHTAGTSAVFFVLKRQVHD